ncbi:MAG: penicillin-binding protein 2 [Thermoflexales bacterium]|nr:penicillin-binding protein 2 [Thermoflexales bacterium]
MAQQWQMLNEEWREEHSILDLSQEMMLPRIAPNLFFRLRQLSFYIVILLVFGIFAARLWQLQVVQRDYWARQAESNRSRLVSLSAPRGIIYDRNGVPLVHNVPNFIVTITPGYLPETEEGLRDHAGEGKIFARLSELLDMPVTTLVASNTLTTSAMLTTSIATASVTTASVTTASVTTASVTTASKPLTLTAQLGIKDLVDRAIDPDDRINYSGPFRPVTIKSGVDSVAAMIILEELSELPGVGVSIAPIREYPDGPIFASLLGYLAGIPASLAEEYAARGYDLSSDKVGLAGLEYTVENDLKGQTGYKYVEEDVAGREMRSMGYISSVAGDSVYLSIDAGLQKIAYETLQAKLDEINRLRGEDSTRRGAVIALNPQTGEVLAMVSLPSYDNNLFARGISWRDYQPLLDDLHRPLVNHAIADQVQPGSTFKIIVASAGLQEEVITPRTQILGSGTLVVPNKYFPNDPGRATRFSCWNKAGHGYLDVVHALAQSCNIFFYETGGGLDIPDEPVFEGLGQTRLSEYSTLFGLGKRTGVDLPGEAEGFVPTATWKRRTFGENWSTGDTYNFSIGEGYLQITPIQMLNAAAAIANDGTLYQPQLVHHVTTVDGKLVRSFQPKTISRLPISSTYLALVRQGMELAVESGTSVGAQVPGVRVAGKTGTAEFCDDLAQQRYMCQAGAWPTHAWFIAFAPAEDPELALIVYIWNGGEGSERAVPVAKEILDYYFHVEPQATE